MQDRLNRYFDTSVFSQPATYTLGNVSRTLPDVRSPGLRNFDISLFKDFKLRESLVLEFRAESFNALNTPQFGWVKSRLHRKAQPVPPIFQPEVGARAVYWSAHHSRAAG